MLFLAVLLNFLALLTNGDGRSPLGSEFVLPTSGNDSATISVDFPGCVATALSRSERIPIFLITRDRLVVLKKMIQSLFDRLGTPFDLILVDNNSTYPDTVEYLNELQRSGVAQVWRDPVVTGVHWDSVTANVNSALAWYREHHPGVQFYAVSDPDLSLRGCAPDLLTFFAALLKACPSVHAIGPSLRLSNIPDSYPLKKTVMSKQTMFWGLPLKIAEWDNRFFSFVREFHV